MSVTPFQFPVASLPNATLLPALMAIQMKNLDALGAAQKAAMAGLGKLAQRQSSILTASLQGTASAPAALLQGDPQTRLTAPIDAVKAAILENTANSGALGEIVATMGAGVATILQDRMLASLDELKAALVAAMQKAA